MDVPPEKFVCQEHVSLIHVPTKPVRPTKSARPVHAKKYVVVSNVPPVNIVWMVRAKQTNVQAQTAQTAKYATPLMESVSKTPALQYDVQLVGSVKKPQGTVSMIPVTT